MTPVKVGQYRSWNANRSEVFVVDATDGDGVIYTYLQSQNGLLGLSFNYDYELMCIHTSIAHDYVAAKQFDNDLEDLLK